MRVVSALLFLLAGLMVAPAQNSLNNLQKVRLYGSTYVRVKEWSEAIDMDIRWITRNEELQVTNRSWKFYFTADSRKAEANGVSLMLSWPIVLHGGTPFISWVDLQETIHPLLYPRKNKPAERIETICLDPGHGGRDPGNMEKNRIQEKKYTLLLAEDLAKLLRQAGFRVILTRTTDQFVDLSDRASFANRNQADLFISLHFNSASSSRVKGAETFCLSPEGTASSNAEAGSSNPNAYPGNAHNDQNILLAYLLQKALLANLPVEDRGVKRARFEVLRGARMPAILIEGGFMSHPTESKNIYDSVYRKEMAQAIQGGILAYKRAVEPESVSEK